MTLRDSGKRSIQAGSVPEKSSAYRFYPFIVVSLSFFVSVVLGVLVISTAPANYGGGDTASYVAFAREIMDNRFLIPTTNNLHFPGSGWVYPPAIPYLFALLFKVFGAGGCRPFEVAALVGVVANALIVVPVWKLTELIFNRTTATIATITFSAYLPNLYAITWGGYPQIFATLLIASILYFTVKLVALDGGKREIIFLGVLMGILYLTHDLSSFVVSSSLLLLSIILLLSGFFSRNAMQLRSAGIKILSSLALSAPAFVYWYFPRLWWVKDAVFGGPSLIFQPHSTIYADLSSLQPVWFHIFPLIPYVVTFLVLLSMSILASFMSSGERHTNYGTGLLSLFLALPLLMMVWKSNDSVLFSRLSYYLFIPASILLSRLIVIGFEELKGIKVSAKMGRETYRKSVGFILSVMKIVLLTVIAVHGIEANRSSHTYYNSFSDNASISKQFSALEWVNANIPNGSVVASDGQLGFYIMGYAGLPTLLYEPPNYLTQPVEWNESQAAYILTNHPAINLSLTEDLILQYNVSYVIIPRANLSVPSIYINVYDSNLITVYEVDMNAIMTFSNVITLGEGVK